MAKIIDVSIGQVKAGRKGSVLRSIAIGSCVAIAAYDSVKKVGGLAHVMLPGRAPEDSDGEKARYAADAIEEILRRITRLGGNTSDIDVCLVGGANVLRKQDDTICKSNIESAIQLLQEKGITIKAKAIGGTERRRVCLDVTAGCVFCMEGDGKEKLLYTSTQKEGPKMVT